MARGIVQNILNQYEIIFINEVSMASTLYHNAQYTQSASINNFIPK